MFHSPGLTRALAALAAFEPLAQALSCAGLVVESLGYGTRCQPGDDAVTLSVVVRNDGGHGTCFTLGFPSLPVLRDVVGDKRWMLPPGGRVTIILANVLHPVPSEEIIRAALRFTGLTGSGRTAGEA